MDSFDLEPSDWLLAHEGLLMEQQKGLVLDLACGNGRNAIYLAKVGFTVEAVDISDVAITWLEERVRELKLLIYPRVVNMETEQLPKQKYQVIVNFNYLQRSLFTGIKEALLPGGLLFFETFTKDHIELLGHKINPDYTLGYNELLYTFSDLRILHYCEAVILDKDIGKKKDVASLVARKVG